MGSRQTARQQDAAPPTTDQRRPAFRAAGEIAAAPSGRRDGPPVSGETRLTIDAHILLIALLSCIVVLVALGLIAAQRIFVAGSTSLIWRGLLLDIEANLPTFFAFLLLGACVCLLALVSARQISIGGRHRLHWVILTGLFLLACFDEAASVHERLIAPLRSALDATGWLYFAWVIPAWAFVALLGLMFFTFLRDLPRPFGWLFTLSGALYLGGALGVEMPAGAYMERHGNQTFVYQVIATVEETLEMLGLAVFAHALVRYLAHQQSDIRLSFRGAAGTRP